MNMEGIMLREIRQIVYDFTYTYTLRNKWADITKTETDLQIENNLVVTREDRSEQRKIGRGN